MPLVHITAVCPSCENSYQVEPTLRGKPMRCPNPQCRTVFTVPAEPTAPQPPASNGRRSGLVGDVVPLVSVEAEAAPSWHSPPPVRRPANLPAAPLSTPEPVAKNAPRETQAEARETQDRTLEPPPVRRVPQAAPTAAPVEAPPEPPVHQYDPPPARGKRLVWIVAGFALGVALLLAVGGYFVWTLVLHTEAGMAKEADTAYKAGNYIQAGTLYKGLFDQFTTSNRRPYYQLMQQLCELRDHASAPDPDVGAVLKDFDSFIDDHKEKDPALLKDRAPDLGQTLDGLAKSLAEHNTNPKDDVPLDVAKQLEESLAKVTELDPAVSSAAVRGSIAKSLGGVRQSRDLNRRLEAAIARLKTAAAAQPASLAVRLFLKLLKQEQAALPEIAQQPEVKQLLEQVYARHLEGVRYNPEGVNLPPPSHEADETHIPSLLVDPLLRGGLSKAPADDSVVLAVVRGVLYALNRTNGRTKWVVRVGVDTTDLPVRVPAAVGVPERILVLSADAKTVTAFDADGVQVWQYRMGAECLGRPLIVNQLAYLATYDGKVHEIELGQGKLLGVFDLGQPLTVGGVRDPNTKLLYFPADDFCVYVLDVTSQVKRCVAVLYTGHAAGSLRSAPLLLSAPDAQGADSDWLVLNQAEGLHATRLRVYHLPVADRDEPAEELKLKPIPGWTWFPPYHDGEKVAMLGDAGFLGIFGIRQVRNPKDPLLFPMLPEYFNVGPAAGAHSRAEVVAVRDRDYWLLAGGELKRLFLELTAKEGPRMKPMTGWDAPILGSPLQATQVEKDPLRGGTSLILVTEPSARQTCLATAVDDREGEILWQRQLGFVCRGEPLALRPAGAKGPPVLLALDRGGGLFAFDPARQTKLGSGEWHEIDKSLYPAMDDGPGAPPVLLPGPDGQSAYQIACPGDGTTLTIRHVEVDPAGGPLKVDAERSMDIKSPLGGRPIVTDSMMVLPLANGILARLPLPLGPELKLSMGPNWRSNKAPPDAVGRLTALGTDTFLASDGGHGLTYWQWPSPAGYVALPKDKESGKPTLELEASLTADPVLLPDARLTMAAGAPIIPLTWASVIPLLILLKGKPRQVCVADVTGTVILLTAADDGHLKPEMSWNVGDPITAGPWVEVLPDGAARIACIIDKHRLIWLDPAKKAILWKHRGDPRPALVGRPRLVGGMVVVADDSGLIVGLDPDKGTVVGKPLRLPGSTTPAASPVGFGADRLFTPLSDGTVLLPLLSRIGAKVDKQPGK
jgi:outer membrane protein assembly factor BamB